jgi:chaperonin GroEL
MGKIIEYDHNARERLIRGAQIVAKAVRVTLGPSGKNVLIRQKGDRFPFATKDGVTVAAHVWSADPIEQQAIESIQEVANNSDNQAGDGTTTATILAEKILELGSISSIEDINLLSLKRGIDAGVKLIVEKLKEISVPCDTDEKLLNVALISSNNDFEISSIVLDAFKVAGKQGAVNIQRSKTKETYLTTVYGMNLPTGYHSIHFITDNGNDIVELDKPIIYITNTKLSEVSDNFNILLKSCSAKQQSILIICKDIDHSVLGPLVQAKIDGVLKVCVCKAPEFGEEQNNLLRDLGVMLGKTPFLENEGIDFDDIVFNLNEKEMPVDYDEVFNCFPKSEAVMVTRNNLSIKGPIDISEKEHQTIEKAKQNRAEFIRSKITDQINQYEKSILQTRISRLTDGLAYINIGASTDVDFIEKQHRIQDALYAVKSASEEGIIPGGGTALYHISENRPRFDKYSDNHSVELGISVIYEAIKAPFVQILENVGIKTTNTLIEKLKLSPNCGIDARYGSFCENMISSGIIDPVKVTRVALENAASIAGMLLTTDCVIVDKEVYEKPNYNQNY